MLSKDWTQRKKSYDYIIIGSGYGGAITAAQLEGKWDGHLIFLTNPNQSLLNRANPVLFRLSFEPEDKRLRCRYRFGIMSGESIVQMTDEFVQLTDFTSFRDEIRMMDQDTLIGKWVSPAINPLLLRGMQNYMEPQENRFAFYYVLKRVKD